jgi:hypothetical protein
MIGITYLSTKVQLATIDDVPLSLRSGRRSVGFRLGRSEEDNLASLGHLCRVHAGEAESALGRAGRVE